jgi:hypothetical protein
MKAITVVLRLLNKGNIRRKTSESPKNKKGIENEFLSTFSRSGETFLKSGS